LIFEPGATKVFTFEKNVLELKPKDLEIKKIKFKVQIATPRIPK